MLRMYLGPPLTKKGKFPQAQVGDLLVEKVRPREIRMTSNREVFDKERKLPDGQTAFTISAQPLGDWGGVARALLKTGLELVALDHGRERACAAEFDAARRFVLEGGEFRSFLIVPPNAVGTSGQIQVSTWMHLPYKPVQFDFFGLHFEITLCEVDREMPVEQAAGSGVTLIPLYGAGKPITP